MRSKRWTATGLLMGAMLMVCASAAAQADNYDRDLKPGLSLHADSSSGSLLSQAARDGVSIVISENGTPAGRESGVETYTVREGDTLWDICTKFFGDPYVWPRVWSYNTRITNPHWIYPGEVIWLVPPRAMPMATPDSAPAVVRAPAQTVLIRNRGFVDKEVLKKSGVVKGAQKETMMLAQFDEAYVQFEDPGEIREGDEFAVFEVLRTVDDPDDPGAELGKLVEILGVSRVTQYDRDKKLARVVIDEAIKPIERGALVGPVHRKFDLIAPAVNGVELKGQLIALLEPGQLAAAHDIVFIDKGARDGVRDGNRFFVVEKRDNYRRINDQPDDREDYPFEVLAEMRVVETRPGTCTCLVTSSVKELSVGAVVEMIKGY